MSFDAFLGAVVEEQVKAGASKKEIDAMVSEIIGVFRDPIILYPSGWMDTLPERIKDQITMERFVQLMKAKGKPIEEATDAEALAYIYSAALVAPMGSEWTNIYLWLGRDYGMPDRERGTPKTLKPDEERMLADLKRWIRNRQKVRGKKTHFIAPGMKKKNKAKMGCEECPVVEETFDLGSYEDQRRRYYALRDRLYSIPGVRITEVDRSPGILFFIAKPRNIPAVFQAETLERELHERFDDIAKVVTLEETATEVEVVMVANGREMEFPEEWMNKVITRLEIMATGRHR